MDRASVKLETLPDQFSYAEARELLSGQQLRALRERGQVVRIAPGVYRKPEVITDDDLLEVAIKSPRATICLLSALSRHDLSDALPGSEDIAVVRGSWQPVVRVPVTWHHFDHRTFDLGRQRLDLGSGRSIGLYSPERTIIDTYRLRHREGAETATIALRRWLAGGGQPSSLLALAREFPQVTTPIRTALEILL